MPLYDGGANKARQQNRSWRIRELMAERDDLIRNFNSDSNRLLNEIEKRSAEMLIINERLDDLTTRHESLMALLGNSLLLMQAPSLSKRKQDWHKPSRVKNL